MAYVMLYGTGGWTQRWQIRAGDEEKVQAEIAQVGRDATGCLSVVDSQTGATVTLMVAWAAVAAAVVVDSDSATARDEATGQYA
ncbi:MAG: hypothetical protein ACXVEU_04720 [Nocardioidaceae bacterium]